MQNYIYIYLQFDYIKAFNNQLGHSNKHYLIFYNFIVKYFQIFAFSLSTLNNLLIF